MIVRDWKHFAHKKLRELQEFPTFDNTLNFDIKIVDYLTENNFHWNNFDS